MKKESLNIYNILKIVITIIIYILIFLLAINMTKELEKRKETKEETPIFNNDIDINQIEPMKGLNLYLSLVPSNNDHSFTKINPIELFTNINSENQKKYELTYNNINIELECLSEINCSERKFTINDIYSYTENEEICTINNEIYSVNNNYLLYQKNSCSENVSIKVMNMNFVELEEYKNVIEKINDTDTTIKINNQKAYIIAKSISDDSIDNNEVTDYSVFELDFTSIFKSTILGTFKYKYNNN